MKKAIISLLALSAASSAHAVQLAPKPAEPKIGLTCVAPLHTFCRGWGRVVFCRCV